MLVGAAYQVTELGHLHHFPVCSMEPFGTLAVDKQVGFTPREHDPRDRGGEDEIGTAARPLGAGTARFERAVEGRPGQAVVVRHELGESCLLSMVMRMGLAGVARGDYGTVGPDDDRAYREGGPRRRAVVRKFNSPPQIPTIPIGRSVRHRAPSGRVR